jgi:hypothetical protein
MDWKTGAGSEDWDGEKSSSVDLSHEYIHLCTQKYHDLISATAKTARRHGLVEQTERQKTVTSACDYQACHWPHIPHANRTPGCGSHC